MTAQTSIEEIYEQVVKTLPPSARLCLATMILNGIPPQSVVDYSTEWSEEDMRNFSAASWDYIVQQVEKEESDAQAG